MVEEQKDEKVVFQNQKKCFGGDNSEVSPLKEIILTFLLNKEKGLGDGTSRWEDPKFQLIHIEPIEGDTICAFTMQTDDKGNGNYEITIDLRFEFEEHEFKIEKAILEPSGKTQYDWDLCVFVGKKEKKDPSSYKIIDESGDPITFKFRKGQYMDFHLKDPETIFQTLDLALIPPRRVCRIGLH